jgi:hypothetical protein
MGSEGHGGDNPTICAGRSGQTVANGPIGTVGETSIVTIDVDTTDVNKCDIGIGGDYPWGEACFDDVEFNVGPTAPVPEPSTYAMTAGGLGMIGLMINRRRRKQEL